MKLALISPQRTTLELDPVRTGTPLGLLSIASLIRRELPNVEIHCIDAMAEGSTNKEISTGVFRYGLTKSELEQRLRNITPDVVGISNIFTSEWKNTQLCAEVAKECGSVVVLGGHHPTYESEFMLRNTKADYVVCGEGEYGFLDLLTTLMSGESPTSVNGIAFLKNNSFFQTTTSRKAINLDFLPDPAFDLLNPSLYKPEFSHSGKIPAGKHSLIDYSLSRGCPIACTFCTSSDMWGKSIRVYSSERVRTQIRKIRSVGFDHLSLEDDQVLMIQDNSLDILVEELGKQGFSWNIDAGVYYPLVPKRKEFFQKAAANGCYRVFLPIEHPAIKFMHEEHKYKNIKVQEDVKKHIQEASEVLNRVGIEFYVAIMVGFKEENHETLELVRDYARFVKEQGAAWVNFFYPKPPPGTSDYNDYHLVDPERRWQTAPEYWTLPTPVLKPKSLTITELTTAVNQISMEVNGYPNTLVSANNYKITSEAIS